jgi:diacylglycerol kinase (ATP)
MKTDRPKPTGFVRLVNAFGNTWKGYVGAFREEAAFRQELALCAVLFPLGLWLGENGVERALLVELLNSGIEATVDRIGLERHQLSGLAKDLGSAAVFTSFAMLGVVWALVLFDR